MKKIINGKLYNTDTAEYIGYNAGGAESTTDFDYFEETLYRKKNGDFFLHGRGGANSCYADCYGNTRMGSQKIAPLTLAEAKEWAEDCCDEETYIELFGQVEE